MKKLFSNILGLENKKDIGIIDTTIIGNTKNITSLKVVQKNNDPLFEISLLSRSRISSHRVTFFWLITPESLHSLHTDIKTIIIALETSTHTPLRGKVFSKIVLYCMGFKTIGNIGPLSITDGTSKASGYIVEKDRTRFLVLQRSVSGNSSEDLLSLSALKAIDTLINTLIN